MNVRPRCLSALPVVLLLPLAACHDHPLAPAAADPAASILGVSQLSFSGGLCAAAAVVPDEARTTPGGVEHVRNSGEFKLHTGNPLVDGDVLAAGLRHTNLAEGVAQERVLVTVMPDAYQGSAWEIVTVLRTRPHSGMLTGRGTGRGTGALAGMLIAWELEPGFGVPEECSIAYYVVGTIRKAAP